jgi:hypothetical protein
MTKISAATAAFAAENICMPAKISFPVSEIGL